ncbi:hypothetical protein ACI3PL_30140, partial [Lacticaseibacillus paracasei]
HAYFVTALRALPADGARIVFTSTCRSCEELALVLRATGLACTTLHSQVCMCLSVCLCVRTVWWCLT